MIRAGWWCLLAATLVCSPAASQEETRPYSVTRISPQDSARAVNLLMEMSVKQIDSVAKAEQTGKSPGLALALSAVLPGAGQFYNESYWKVPILLGFGYYFASQWIDANDSIKHYRRLYGESITPENSAGNPTYSRLREDYKDIRDTFSWYIFIYYLVNLVDAYVDASLYDFNVGDDLSIRLMPEFDHQYSHSARLRLRIGF
ncbi:MAG: hypothetical protein KF749_13995 [Bacteroidetes bacterium]|nr:hypothetical protein [Bacteroidota bacterium]MCW5895229.1 hypothetical protein [Bacteroidota bacterium]